MSYYIVYAHPDRPDDPTDGETIASGKGWLNWGDYVLGRSDEFPEAAHLAQEGWLEWIDGPTPEELEHELEQLTHADDPDAAAVSAHLLAAVKARPEGTTYIQITDGTEPGDDDEDDDTD